VTRRTVREARFGGPFFAPHAAACLLFALGGVR
jgi:hypothetical protein